MAHPHGPGHGHGRPVPERDPSSPDDPWKGLLVGTRVRMTAKMPDDPHPIAKGECGTVREILGTRLFPQVDVAWDSGRTIFLLPSDPFEVIE